MSLATVILTMACACCGCCARHRSSQSLLAHVAVGTTPASLGFVLSRWSRLASQHLPLPDAASSWAVRWECAAADDDDPSLIVTPCALLAIANVLSISAPLWVGAICMHLLHRATCATGTRPWHCVRHTVCDLLPLLLCLVLIFDRACDTADDLMQPVCSNGTVLGAPPLASWVPLAAGFVNVGTAADAADWVTSTLLPALSNSPSAKFLPQPLVYSSERAPYRAYVQLRFPPRCSEAPSPSPLPSPPSPSSSPSAPRRGSTSRCSF